ncbi:hypothetical protein MBLNU459_g5156t1 [Dothideomycetes sp. NU459]
MTVRANMFTPEVLLSAPRRSAGVPNPDGSAVLYTTSTYSFDSHSKTTELRWLDVKTKESTLVTDEGGVSEPVWLPGDNDSFVCLKSGDKGSTDIVVGSVKSEWKSAYVAGTLDAPASSLKIAQLSSDSYAVVLAAQAYLDGSLYNPDTAPKAHSTGKLYKTIFVRHWDEYLGKEKNALWYSTLKKSKDNKYELGKFANALKGTGLESPIAPFGGGDNFDVGSSGIIFVSKDPSLNGALHVKCNVYHVRLSSFAESEAPKPLQYKLPGFFQGASTCPVFSPDGKRAAFLSMTTDGYEAEKNQAFVVPDLSKDSAVRLLDGDKTGPWDRSPQSVSFSHNGELLYFMAEDEGYGRLFSLASDPSEVKGLPRKLTSHGYVLDVRPLISGKVFFSSSSLVDNSLYTIFDPASSPSDNFLWSHSATKDGSSLGLKRSQVSSILTPASDPSVNKHVHSWVFKPSDYDSKKKYPLAMLIHGGPQGSWGDSWSTRWNPAIFASQGYVVVAPNPTGSTGYGQGFTNAIRKDWGGAPYQDIVNVFSWVEANMPEVDVEHAVALGASYGGYMMNWIQGHDLGRKFKALVCHDGIFSTAGLLATEELYFPFYDLGGTPWHSVPSSSSSTSTEGRERADKAQQLFGASSLDAWAKNDPSRFLDRWSTPQLVIHSSKDYRLCISEGLSAFNVLQARGVESQFLTFPDENHWVLKPENSLVWHKVVLNFINKHAGLPAFCAEAEHEHEDGHRDAEGGGLAFYGGKKADAKAELVEMVGIGKPET